MPTLVIGDITDLGAMAPHIEEERRVLSDLLDRKVLSSAFIAQAEAIFYAIAPSDDGDHVTAEVSQLALVRHGVMSITTQRIAQLPPPATT